MVPATGITVKPILDVVAAVDAKLSEADALAADDAKRYGALIEAASHVVTALEQEYIDILREAALTRLTDAEEARRLAARIDSYIHGEVLRPRLRRALSGLQAGRVALAEHAERLLIWPSARLARSLALAQYDRLLSELAQYLGSLGDYTGPSAVGLEELRALRAALDEAGKGDAFRAHVDVLLMGLDKSVLLNTVARCGRAVEALRVAFR